MIKIKILNNDKTLTFQDTVTVRQILEKAELQTERPVLGAKVNNRLRELSSKVFTDSEVLFIDITHSDGIRMIQRGLVFTLYIAAKELFPTRKLKVLHSIENGLYCELGNWVLNSEIEQLKNRMSELIDADYHFTKHKLDKRLALMKFEENGDIEKVRLFRFRKKSTVNVYKCGT